MNPEVKFKYRQGGLKEGDPKRGYFYWIDLGETHELWFAPDTVRNHMILLNGFDEEAITNLINRVADPLIQEKLTEFKTEILEQISILMDSDLDFVTRDELPTKVSELENDAGYLTEVPDVELTDSDYDEIAERVVIHPLKWEIIK